MSQLTRLTTNEFDVVLALTDQGPHLAYFGAPLGPDADLAATLAALGRPVPNGGLDIEPVITLVPEHGSGFPGRPGLAGRSPGGSGWAPRFIDHEVDEQPGSITVTSVEPVVGLRLVTTLQLDAEVGVLDLATTLENTGERRYLLDRLGVAVPLPAVAAEVLSFTGRWCGEYRPRRIDWDAGVWSVENRRGRTSHDHVPVAFAGTAGFGEDHGEVWGVHLAWSGNSEVRGERLTDGRRLFQANELLFTGEVVLEPGESYTSPTLRTAYSARGLNGVSAAFHRAIRSYGNIPGVDRPRAVLLNTWEAVYFNHDLATLTGLADRAAEVGIERFVLDDGWFHGRRSDDAGLGDWWVDADVWPDGLAPLIDHVRGLGLEFGIWVEPEMVNPDSELYRSHPDWVLTDPDYEPVLGRNQLVLNLANPDAYAHIFEHLDRLLADHDVGYVKWDMNRDLVHASHQGRAGVRDQTLAAYRLIDELGAAHPDVEIESCSSGGARADHEILKRTVRLWASDCNDALERQTIDRGYSYLFPPEVVGSHIGPTVSHTTGRRHGLAFRAATAFFGHFGVEWNLLDTPESDRAALAEFIALHKEHRAMLHSGDYRRFDHPDPSAHAHGVIATDQGEAIVSYAQLTSPRAATPEPLRVTGLDPDTRYRVRPLALPDEKLGSHKQLPGWVTAGSVELSGRQLMHHGLQLPVLHPESAYLLHLVRV